jgi:hypothetical protein
MRSISVAARAEPVPPRIPTAIAKTARTRRPLMVPLQIDYRAPSHQNTSAVVGTDLYELVEALASCESIVITAKSLRVR